MANQYNELFDIMSNKFSEYLLDFARYGGKLEDVTTSGNFHDNEFGEIRFFVSVPKTSYKELCGEELVKKFKEEMINLHEVKEIGYKKKVKVFCKIREEHFDREQEEELTVITMLSLINAKSKMKK